MIIGGASGTTNTSLPFTGIKNTQTNPLEVKDRILPGGCLGGDNDVAKLEQEIEALKQKMSEKGEIARKGYLLSVLGTFGVSVACMGTFSIYARLPLLALSTVSLAKGSQLIHDKVMHDIK
ncbi:MAG TPA: hypothetical protein PL110_09320 [Candidatus Eremiobacteraeota bacterium]|nr:MAG: hypothetical protein BWY64_00972 [bacterium ADurb.Bin363]HPZ08302.1 hypothetical protein [Candidatus Eremiobacteraeota bacterium]